MSFEQDQQLKQIWKQAVPGNTIYHVNPYGCGASIQGSVQLQEITIAEIKRQKLGGLIGKDTITYTRKGSDFARTIYRTDMAVGVKFTSTVKAEAEDYLRRVHANEFLEDVAVFHHNVRVEQTAHQYY